MSLPHELLNEPYPDRIKRYFRLLSPVGRDRLLDELLREQNDAEGG